MVGTYALHWDTDTNHVDFALAGLWDESLMDRWLAELEDSLEHARPGWTLVGDLTAYPAQEDLIAERQARMMTMCQDHGMSRGALVMPRAAVLMEGSPLHRQAGLIDEATKAVATREEALEFVQG